MLGVGNMSGAVLAGLTRPGYGPTEPIRVTNRTEARAATHRSERVIAHALENTPTANVDAALGAGVVVLGVKPGMIADLLDEVRDAISPDAVVVSVAAGVTIESIERRLAPGTRVVRAMPNTPATLGLGVTGIARGTTADDRAIADARALFEAVGDVVEVYEAQLDIVTGISGSGPAYVYLVVEELMRTAEVLGLDAERARTLAVGTVRGAGAMLAAAPETEPSELRHRVTSPGGTTERAIAVLQQGGLGDLIERAVRANIQRSNELAAENS
ncbi:pyrroline-5-carboxylate reductase [Pseudoclavibacter endophyticus]|uniref:Pyrroline-5-carboxylate reductase n=2 Tax=Pseudoclavibacter endophyticus TaxID=1778590 RepID=A0A6H9WHK4_9MICO|nr:pyrroline-5-carboxylate reductase [Pseudoclavibacter endophyticus]